MKTPLQPQRRTSFLVSDTIRAVSGFDVSSKGTAAEVGETWLESRPAVRTCFVSFLSAVAHAYTSELTACPA